MNKGLKITLIVLSSLIVFLMVFVLLFKAGERIKYNSFYKNAQKEFAIPGLMEGYVPQGFDYMEKQDVFLACGYMKDTSQASRVYVIRRDGTYTCTELKKKDGTNYTGHTGGIAYYSDYLYITGSDGIDVFKLSDVLKGKEATVYQGTVSTLGVDPAYCFVYDGILYTGSFYKAGDYDTPKEHHIKTFGGDENKALMIGFYLDGRGTYGIIPYPCATFSMPSYVQGVTMTDTGKLLISTSWGLTTSRIYVHDFEKVAGDNCTTEATKVLGVETPLYCVDSSTLVETIEAPPMAEEIVYLDGKIWVMNESASSKYIFGRITTGNDVYSYKLVEKSDI